MKISSVLASGCLLLILGTALTAHPKARVFDVRDATSVKVAIDRVYRGLPLKKVVVDSRGTQWAVNGGGSLMVYLPKSKRWTVQACPAKGDLIPGNFDDLLVWGGRLVLKSPYSGLVLYSFGSFKPLMPRALEGGKQVRDFAVHQGDLWIAASDGLYSFSDKTLRRKPHAIPEDLTGTPWAIASNGGELVLATDTGGLAILANEAWEVLAPGEEGLHRPVSVMIADGGRVLLGGAGWLEEWRLMGGYVDILQENPSLGRLVVSDLCLLDGILWVATIGQGLLHRKDGRWDQLLPPFQDLGSPILFGLTPTPEGDVLVSQSLGLSRVRVVER